MSAVSYDLEHHHRRPQRNLIQKTYSNELCDIHVLAPPKIKAQDRLSWVARIGYILIIIDAGC